MINQHNVKQVDGLDKELLLLGTGYVARPVTVDKSTITGLTPTDKGRYIIPQGTYLKGDPESLLVQPQQVAKQANVAVTKASAALITDIHLEAVTEGAVTYQVATVDPAKANVGLKVEVDTTAKKVTVTLKTDSKKAIMSTLNDVVKAINEDMIANTYVKAKVDDAKKDDVASAGTATLAGGGAEVVTDFIDGILYHSVDVTDGENTGALIIHGIIDIDKMPMGVGEAVKKALPHITFGRKD